MHLVQLFFHVKSTNEISKPRINCSKDNSHKKSLTGTEKLKANGTVNFIKVGA